eukprot:1013417-Alexandrium_andersonii.AAC.1
MYSTMARDRTTRMERVPCAIARKVAGWPASLVTCGRAWLGTGHEHAASTRTHALPQTLHPQRSVIG